MSTDAKRGPLQLFSQGRVPKLRGGIAKEKESDEYGRKERSPPAFQPGPYLREGGQTGQLPRASKLRGLHKKQ